MACTCNSVCSAVCSRVCNTVGTVTNGYGTPDVATDAPGTTTIFTKVANAINAFRTRFGFSTASMSVTAAASILATDWNTTLCGNVTPVTWAVNTTPYTLNQSLTLSSATASSTILNSTNYKPNDLITLLNSKYCTSVCIPNCKTVCACDTDCGCDSACSCESACSCDGYEPCGVDGL
jgi:hypothetical protein